MTSRTDVIGAFAPAKINLFLHVGEKRADGFHDIESLVVFAEAGDTLTFAQSGELTLALDGPFAKGLEAEGDNLVLRAARALAAHAGRSAGAAITLTKNLPVASGIGGGSADAAAALRGLTRLWALDMSWPDLRAIAETLGSDVPVCVESKSSWMEGRGERVTPAGALAEMAMVLVNPGVAVPTAGVFRDLKTRHGTGTIDHAARMLLPRELIAFLKTTSNDLEMPARAFAPVIGEVLSELSRMPGVELWRMSGSGATCFALFEDEGAAEMAAIALSHSHPQWWVQATRIAS
ncbi:MAG: 4-(cytidine 5'-diphospho)-2-C-methyl-D-erythritol kinase [Rhizomicrobium sp.]